MTDSDKKDPANTDETIRFPGDESDAPAAANDSGPAAEPGEHDEAGEPDPFTVLEKLNAENTELKDRMLRTLAEMENLRRRTQREVADAKAYGVTSFARDMLVFADNLRRALENVPEEARANDALRGFVEGIEVTERDFLSRLERHGVKKLAPKGERFDPNLHEALYEVPDPSVAAGTVVQVVEDGYVIADRCLRPAKVGVARGGPKPEPAKANGDAAADTPGKDPGENAG